MGGHLVTINDADEDTFVFDTFALHGGMSRSLWIGLSDRVKEGVFVWASGEVSSYTRWAGGEPNNLPNSLTGEDFVHIQPPGSPVASRWNDTAGPEFMPGACNGVVEIMPAEPIPKTWTSPATDDLPSCRMQVTRPSSSSGAGRKSSSCRQAAA